VVRDDGRGCARLDQRTATEAAVWVILREIPDPEIPALSLVDLGMIRRVQVGPGGIVIELMPTFLGCPALYLMAEVVEDRVRPLGPVQVAIVRDEAWSTDRITGEGRRKLAACGFAPPPRGDASPQTSPPAARCPYCGSDNTVLESAFGPTPCRAIHYCRTCRQPFEQFKPV
jgi:ring-1,2-phenylacetyl-CoA epoxidase subunit PaaD